MIKEVRNNTAYMLKNSKENKEGKTEAHNAKDKQEPQQLK